MTKKNNLPNVWNKAQNNEIPEGTMWIDPLGTSNPKIWNNEKWEEIPDEDMDWGKE
tara:strand:- start:1434 stop:1601 length:168 start_codon:yes stop_codon:yes gene_type:complete